MVISLQLILANQSLIGYILVSLVLFGSTSKKVGCIGGLFIMSFLFYLLLVEQINLYRWEDNSFFCSLFTTRNACFAEGQISGTRQRNALLRASHRSPRQRTALDKEAFAEGTALGKDRSTANQIFAAGRGPRQRCPRQIRPVGSRRPFPSSFAEGHPLGPRQMFFSCATRLFDKKNFKSLPRVLDQALGKDFLKTSFRPIFFLYKSALPRARG